MANGRRSATAAVPLALVILALMLPIRTEAVALREVPVCPERYPLDGVKLTKVPAGWVSEVFEAFRLESVTVAVGDPTHEGEIIPDSKKVKGGSEIIFSGLDGFPKQRWLVCNYGYGGVIRLYQKLDQGIKSCTVKFVPYPGPVKWVFHSYHCD
jgi:hypothetical protein